MFIFHLRLTVTVTVTADCEREPIRYYSQQPDRFVQHSLITSRSFNPSPFPRYHIVESRIKASVYRVSPRQLLITKKHRHALICKHWRHSRPQDTVVFQSSHFDFSTDHYVRFSFLVISKVELTIPTTSSTLHIEAISVSCHSQRVHSAWFL